jgi:hypothetical protein
MVDPHVALTVFVTSKVVRTRVVRVFVGAGAVTVTRVWPLATVTTGGVLRS